MSQLRTLERRGARAKQIILFNSTKLLLNLSLSLACCFLRLFLLALSGSSVTGDCRCRPLCPLTHFGKAKLLTHSSDASFLLLGEGLHSPLLFHAGRITCKARLVLSLVLLEDVSHALQFLLSW